ncbi:MAG: hypothetical protein ACOX2E_08800 [Syntrophaceticus sp.]|jgi:hypothetical protein
MAKNAANIERHNTSSNQKKNIIETPKAKDSKDIKNNKQEKVHLEFPYDDLEFLYEYTLKEMGIKDPFK